jgi:hypothetical protein
MHFDIASSAGMLPIRQPEDPGAQGAAITGTQGAGVKSTGGGRFVAGFATLLHIAKGKMLVMGMLSMIVAAGIVAIVLFLG